ncbi:MAG: GTP-binding protein EngB [Bacteroidota bacterium]|nr:GTP-binding protein EngB [Bacteroidota bacterium]
MVKEKKQEKALRAIHNSIRHIKMMILQGKTNEEIFNYVDEIEYLPQLLLSKTNATDIFEQQLEKISEKFDYQSLWLRYQDNYEF